MPSMKILVVEDDPSTAEDVRLVLETFGYGAPRIVTTAEEALEAVAVDDFGLVLMDVELAGELDGVEAGRRLLDDGGIPLIYLTGRTDEGTLRRIEETAPFGYVPKPFNARHLKTAVELAVTRHRLEERLREREERFRLLIENAHDIITVLSADGTIRYESPSVEGILGFPPEELVGRDAFDLVHPEDVDRVRDSFAAVLRQPGRSRTEEFRLRHAAGEWRTLEATGSAFVDEEKKLRVVVNSRDVTEARRADAELRTSEERYRRLFEDNLAGVFRRSLDGRLLEVNAAFARMFGYDSPEDMVGVDVDEAYVSGEEREAVERRLREAGVLQNAEIQVRRRDGERLWIMVNASLQESFDGGPPSVSGTVIDITRQKWLAAELERMAYHDPLTGLANRRALEGRAEQLLALADRHGSRVGLIYLDLSRFKRINDSLGHSAGDEVLVETASRLREFARGSDLVARVGGDEFAVLLTEVAGSEGAVAAARRLTRGFSEPVKVGERSFHVGAQLGVALYPDHAPDFPGLLAAADRAMYRAKASRRGAVTLYMAEGEAVPTDELAMEEAFHAALREGQFVLHYQPIVRVADGSCEGAEALVRWRHPERGVLDAGEFVPFAERSSMIRRLDRWVVRDALRQLAEWTGAGRGPLRWLAVNLSPASLREAAFVDDLGRWIEESDLDPGRLVLEITEHAAVQELSAASVPLRRLKEMGVSLALDDFGAGSSALVHLRQLPADILKIGGQFIHDLERSPEKAALAGAVIRLGQALGLTLVTEQVEREAQQAWVEESGCDLVQGFLIGRPVPAEEFDRAVGMAVAGGGRRAVAG